MSFDVIIKTLRDGATNRRTIADDDRQRAAEHQALAANFTARAADNDELAEAFGLLAEALSTGRLTRKQLREIVTGALTDDNPEQSATCGLRIPASSAESIGVDPATTCARTAGHASAYCKDATERAMWLTDPTVPADEQPRDVFGRCPVHLLPLDENGVCQFNEDDQHPEEVAK